jgi:hypothetical protein
MITLFDRYLLARLLILYWAHRNGDTDMTRTELVNKIKHYQAAHEQGQITEQELKGFLEAIAKENLENLKAGR